MTAVMTHATPTRTQPTPNTTLRVLLLLVLLVAFGVRAWTLDAQSLWSDEGISLNRASLPLDQLLASLPVEHAPGYFVALHGWLGLLGTSDFSLRFFSLWPGVLSVALLYRLTAESATPAAESRLIGALAAALLSTNAFQLWYSQETRMYAWLLAMGLLATWALWRILFGRGGWGWILTYATSAAACVYLHYYGALVPISHALYVAAATLITRRWDRAVRWLAASAGALLLFAPWLPRALGILSFDGWREGGSPAEIPLRYLTAYSVGDAMPAPLRAWLPFVYAGLALLGLLWWLRVRPAGGLLWTATLLLPVAAVYALALRNPDFHERYTIGVAASLLALSAAGVLALTPATWRARAGRSRALWAVPVFAALLLLGSNGVALERQASDTSLHKPDFRAAAQRIQTQQRPGDVILVDGPNPALVFNHYYRGAAPVVDLRGLEDAPAEIVAQRLMSATAGFARAWEILYFHEPAAVQVWLATQAWATEPSWHNNIRVTLYGLPSNEPAATRTLDLAVGPALTLQSASLAPAAPLPGDVLRVTTDWLTLAPPPEYKFSLRLIDPAGAALFVHDYVPQNWFAPTSVWVVGNSARDQHGFHLPPSIAPGRYTVTLRLYTVNDGAAVPTAAGLDIPLGEVEVGP